MQYYFSLALLISIGSSAFARDIALLVHSYPPANHAEFSFELHRQRFVHAFGRRPDLTPLALRAYSRLELARRIDRLELVATDRITHLMFTGDGSPARVGGLDFEAPETWAALARLENHLAPDATVAFVACQFSSSAADESTRDAEQWARRFGLKNGRIYALHARLGYPFDANLLRLPWRVPVGPERWSTGVEQSFVLLAALILALNAGDHVANGAISTGALLGGYIVARQMPRVLDGRKPKASRFQLDDGRVVSHETLSFRELQRRFVVESCDDPLVAAPVALDEPTA